MDDEDEDRPERREERLGRWEAWGFKSLGAGPCSLEQPVRTMQPVTGHLRQRFNVNWDENLGGRRRGRGHENRPLCLAW